MTFQNKYDLPDDAVLSTDMSAGSRGARMSTAVGFLAIPNLREVEERVRRLVHQVRDAQAS